MWASKSKTTGGVDCGIDQASPTQLPEKPSWSVGTRTTCLCASLYRHNHRGLAGRGPKGFPARYSCVCCTHVHIPVCLRARPWRGSCWRMREVLVYMCSHVYSSLYQQLKQGCRLRGSYVQLPATGEIKIQGPATRQTVSEPSCWLDPHCTHICIHMLPPADLHHERPSCQCSLCASEYPVPIYVAASIHIYFLCVRTQNTCVCVHTY